MQTEPCSRRGSALVIVLGFLAVLLILVFAFAIKMQTEYRMARVAESNVRTEFVMVQGIHLTALEVGHPVRRALAPDSSSYWFYPRREVINGAGVLVGDNTEAIVYNYLQWPADAFIPQGIYDIAMSTAMSNRIGILPFNFGGPVSDYAGRTGGGCGEPNRYVATGFEPSGVANCIINCSGYLDIHAPYGTKPRKYGLDAREINLTDIIATPATLAAGRANYKRIESTMELYAYSPAFGLTSPNDLSLFTPYSLSRTGQYWDTNSVGVVDSMCLTGEVSSLIARSTEVLNAFERAGFDKSLSFGGVTYPPEAVRGWLYTNLLNYMDTDLDPRGVEQPSQEQVAGFNEIVVRSNYSCTRSASDTYNYSLGVSVTFEIWRPHVMATSLSQDYVVTVPRLLATVTQVSGPGFALARNSTPCAATASVTTRSPVTMSPDLTITPTTVTTNIFVKELVYTLNMPALRLFFNPTRGYEVDRVVGPITITITNKLGDITPLVGDTVSNSDEPKNSLECIDPRVNWDGLNTAMWQRSTNATPGNTNAATIAYLTDTANNTDYEPGDDTNKATYAFCADRRPLDTVGELGYLVVAPWRTVRLTASTGRPVDRVVDTFSTEPPAYARGLINPNTCFTGVLQAAFNQMPKDLYPGDPAAATNIMSSTNAAAIALAILNHTYLTNDSYVAAASTNGLRNGMLNRSQLGEIPTVFMNPTLLKTTLGIDCEFLRESLIRNTVGLLSTRNVHYTAVLAASDEIDGGGGIDFDIRGRSRMGAEHKAIAMVWRDPWTKETFIRHFRYLPNDGVLDQY